MDLNYQHKNIFKTEKKHRDKNKDAAFLKFQLLLMFLTFLLLIWMQIRGRIFLRREGMIRAPEDKLEILTQGGKIKTLACLQDQLQEQEQRGLEKILRELG